MLYEFISRRFTEPGDVEQALKILHDSDGLEKARSLAWEHAGFAVAAIMKLPDSPARSSLIRIVDLALHRSS